MGLMSGNFSFSADNTMLSDGLIVKGDGQVGGFILPVIELSPVQKHLVYTSLTVSSSTVALDTSLDFSVACDPLAHVGLCISLLGQGFAQRNWQELMSCRLSFSVCGTTVLPRSVRKPEEPRPYTLYKAEKFAAARRSRRQEVLRL